ncbi:MAG: HAMP domain-containing sensor histidine kinase [Candidatus Nealsonbacteria bacterium]
MFTSSQFIFPFLAGLFIISIGFFILLMERKNTTYQKFFGLGIAIGVWSISMAFFNVIGATIPIILHLAVSSAILIPPFFTLTLINYPSSENVISKKTQFVIWFGAIAMIITSFVWPKGFTSGIITIDGSPSQTGGPIYNLFLFYFVFYFLIGFISLGKTFYKNIGRIRAQIVSGIIGMIIAAIGIFSTSIVPALLNTRSFYWSGSFFTVVGMIVLAYMIFETRWVWARIFPIIFLGIALIVALIGQMIFAKTIEISVFSGTILAGTTLLTIFLVRDILVESADRKRLEELLRKINKANEELIRADKVKSEFLTIVSHHLRTPLTHIKWTMAEFLKGSYGKITLKQKNIIQNLIIRNDESVRFVYSLLDISKIRAGKITLNPKPVDIKTFLKNIVLKFHDFAKTKNIKIILEDTKKIMPVIYIDKETITRVFENIIENAIIYNKPGGKVEIKTKLKKNTIDIIVSDTGIGISKNNLSRIGERFFRTPKAMKHAAEGTGLGIAIAKEILKAHSGRLEIYSIIDRGTNIIITLSVNHKPKSIQQETKNKL